MKLKLHILPYTHALAFVPSEPTLAIRIWEVETRDYQDARGNWDNGPSAPMQVSEHWVSIIGQRFGDVDPDRYRLYGETKIADGMLEHESNHIISDVQATAILEEFAWFAPAANALLVHCNAGSSRSPAVALALRDIFDITYDLTPRAKRVLGGFQDRIGEGWHKPEDVVGNLTVYNTLMRAGNKLKQEGKLNG